MRKISVVCIVLLLSCSAYATLSDLNPSSWRTSPPGQSTTTMQAWSFDDISNPTAPELVYNSFGTPTLNVSSETYLQSYMGHNGIYRYTAIGEISMYIPNSGNNDPGTWKEIWIQIIYSDPYGVGFEIPIATVPGYDSFARVSSQSLDNYYMLDTYSIKIIPNPPGEEIIALTIQCAMYVDEIVVDTICVPEPATIVLLGLAGLLIRKKR